MINGYVDMKLDLPSSEYFAQLGSQVAAKANLRRSKSFVYGIIFVDVLSLLCLLLRVKILVILVQEHEVTEVKERWERSFWLILADD